jgi:hypothetical protein
VKLTPPMDMNAAARHIFCRQSAMLARGWDGNLERFLGLHPLRHRLFAALDARGMGSPSINVSWKGVYPDLGAAGSVRDVACFAASGAVHVSAHVDANGMSLSVTSKLSREAREDLLQRIVGLLGAAPAERILSLEDRAEPGLPKNTVAAGAMPAAMLSA